jgi:hypothetical protein
MNDQQDKFAGARENARAWFISIEDMLKALDQSVHHDATDADHESAERAIHESVLSVMVRDGWRQPGTQSEDGPDEYEILLSTGGPALRIWGTLDDHCRPNSAVLQMQDWGTQWERYPAPEATLLRFVQVFWFGE